LVDDARFEIQDMRFQATDDVAVARPTEHSPTINEGGIEKLTREAKAVVPIVGRRVRSSNESQRTGEHLGETRAGVLSLLRHAESMQWWASSMTITS